jgi:polyisoprenoid-binding protein YceI
MSVTTGTALPTGLVAGTYTIDPSHSEVGFVTRHAMVTKVRGRFTDLEGTLVFGDVVEASTATATLQVASVTTGSSDRDAHLRSPDFFDAETYPTIAFRSTGVRADGEDFLLDGELTIKDVTRAVTVAVEFGGAATDPFGFARAGFSGELEVDREDWGLTWNAALETGGVLVSKKVRLHLEISAVRQG